MAVPPLTVPAQETNAAATAATEESQIDKILNPIRTIKSNYVNGVKLVRGVLQFDNKNADLLELLDEEMATPFSQDLKNVPPVKIWDDRPAVRLHEAREVYKKQLESLNSEAEKSISLIGRNAVVSGDEKLVAECQRALSEIKGANSATDSAEADGTEAKPMPKNRRDVEKFITSALVGKVWTSQFSSGKSEDLCFLEGGKGYRLHGSEKAGDFTYRIDGDQVLTIGAGYHKKITLKNSVEGEVVYMRSADDHVSCPFVFSRTIPSSDKDGSQ